MLNVPILSSLLLFSVSVVHAFEKEILSRRTRALYFINKKRLLGS